MAHYAVVRLDKAEVGYKRQFRGEAKLTSYSE